MDRIYNSFDTIESYKFSFGQYRGKSLDDIKENDDAVEYLKWYRKKIKKEVKNPKALKFQAYNKRGLKEIEDYLVSIGEPIEITNFEELETNIESTKNEEIDKTKNEEIDKIVEEKIEENIESIKESNLSNLSFKQLLNLMEEKILERYDEKFQSRKYIRQDYKDYLCLRYCNLTYLELLEKQEKNYLIKIIIEL